MKTKLKNEINISLIKANRTRIDSCKVTGVAEGYDVYGGGAGNNVNGTGEYGIAGGFVGWNNEGLLKNNNMYFADVIRGAKDLTGPFSGKTNLDSPTGILIHLQESKETRIIIEFTEMGIRDV